MRSSIFVLAFVAGFLSSFNIAAAQDTKEKVCPGDAEAIEGLRSAGFLSRRACPAAEALKDAVWRYRLTLGSAASGDLTAAERDLFKDREKRKALREPLKSALKDDEIKRQLIATGALDSDVEHATLGDLREAWGRFRAAIGSVSLGAPTDAEKSELKEQKDKMDAFAGFQFPAYPGGAMDIVVPANLVGFKGQGDKDWFKFERDGGAISVHYFANPVRAFTANAMATKLLEKRRGLYFDYLSLAGDQFTFEGSAAKRDPATDTELPVRELLMATGREQGGVLTGVHVKATVSPPAGMTPPQLKVAALSADRLPSVSKLPETPEQTNWRLVVKALNNLIVSEFNARNGRSTIPIQDCRGVQSAPVVGRKIVNIVYATARNYLAKGGSPDQNSLKTLFGSESGPSLRIGCVRVSVPVSRAAETAQVLPAARDMNSAGAKVIENAAVRPFEYSIPAEPPKEIDLNHKTRYYFPADERTALTSYDRALLFIHGYNNDFEEAIKRTAQIASAADYDGFIYTFSWPSQGRFSRYAADMDFAESAEFDLVSFMRMILSTGTEMRLDVIAHSMGSQILLRTLDAVRPMFDRRLGQDLEGKVRFGQVIFAAPDVAEPVFRSKVVQLRQFADRVTVYASANDGALDFSGWLRGVTRAGAVDANGKPVLVDNIDVIDITGRPIPRYLFTRYLSSTHSAFAFDKEVLEDIHAILEQSGVNDKWAKWAPNLRAAAAGQPGKFLPGDCSESRGGKVSWWKMQTADKAVAACPLQASMPTGSTK